MYLHPPREPVPSPEDPELYRFGKRGCLYRIGKPHGRRVKITFANTKLEKALSAEASRARPMADSIEMQPLRSRL